jgi:hypothetical protein
MDALGHGLYLLPGQAGVDRQVQSAAGEVVGMVAWPRVVGKERTLVQWPVSPSHRVGRQPGSGEGGSGWCWITAGQEDETVVVRGASGLVAWLSQRGAAYRLQEDTSVSSALAYLLMAGGKERSSIWRGSGAIGEHHLDRGLGRGIDQAIGGVGVGEGNAMGNQVARGQCVVYEGTGGGVEPLRGAVDNGRYPRPWWLRLARPVDWQASPRRPGR